MSDAAVKSSWTLMIPRWHPIRLNELMGRHRMVIHRMKRSQDDMVATYRIIRGVPKATGKRRVTLVLTLVPKQKGGDPDAYWKCLLDSLVSCGALKEDSRRWVELAPVRYERGGATKTTILLEDMEDEHAAEA